VFKFASGTPYWDYVNVWGQVYDCNDLLLTVRDQLYAQVQLEGETHKTGKAYAKVASPFDIRSFDMIKAGCCPPGLVNEILGGGPG